MVWPYSWTLDTFCWKRHKNIKLTSHIWKENSLPPLPAKFPVYMIKEAFFIKSSIEEQINLLLLINWILPSSTLKFPLKKLLSPSPHKILGKVILKSKETCIVQKIMMNENQEHVARDTPVRLNASRCTGRFLKSHFDRLRLRVLNDLNSEQLSSARTTYLITESRPSPVSEIRPKRRSFSNHNLSANNHQYLVTFGVH